MTTTGHLFDDAGQCVARIVDDADVIDATGEGRGKIATVRDGKLYDLEGNLLGRLVMPEGHEEPAPAAFIALLDKPTPA